MNKDPWQTDGLKHLPFHSWFRQRSYSNPQYTLEEIKYKIEVSGNIYTSKESRSVTLDGQVILLLLIIFLIFHFNT